MLARKRAGEALSPPPDGIAPTRTRHPMAKYGAARGRVGATLLGVNARFVVPRLLGVLTVLFLLQLVTAQGLSLFPRVLAIDFYGYWRIAAARRFSEAPLGTPYRDRFQYRDTLAAAAEKTDDAKFRQMSRSVKRAQSTGTPLIYLLFAALP